MARSRTKSMADACFIFYYGVAVALLSNGGGACRANALSELRGGAEVTPPCCLLCLWPPWFEIHIEACGAHERASERNKGL